jgi:hypothetical protein
MGAKFEFGFIGASLESAPLPDQFSKFHAILQLQGLLENPRRTV